MGMWHPDEIERLRSDLEETRDLYDLWRVKCNEFAAEIEELRELVLDLTQQGVYTSNDGLVDSCAISTYAEALRYLAKVGKFTIETQVHRRVLGRWTDE